MQHLSEAAVLSILDSRRLMSNRKSPTSFEINLKLSPAEALRRITEESDEMNAKTDKEAWMSLFRGYRGSSQFLYLLNRNGIFLQRRTQLSGPHYGVRIRIESASHGSKLVGHLALTPKLRAFWALWCGVIILGFIIVVISIPREVAAGEKPKSDLLWILFPVGMLMAGYLFNSWGKFFSKRELREAQGWLSKLYADAKVNL